MTRRVCGALALALALAFSLPSVASADITIGSTTKPSGSTGATGGSAVQTFVQVGSASFPIAVPAGGGRIAQLVWRGYAVY